MANLRADEDTDIQFRIRDDDNLSDEEEDENEMGEMMRLRGGASRSTGNCLFNHPAVRYLLASERLPWIFLSALGFALIGLFLLIETPSYVDEVAGLTLVIVAWLLFIAIAAKLLCPCWDVGRRRQGGRAHRPVNVGMRMFGEESSFVEEA